MGSSLRSRPRAALGLVAAGALAFACATTPPDPMDGEGGAGRGGGSAGSAPQAGARAGVGGTATAGAAGVTGGAGAAGSFVAAGAGGRAGVPATGGSGTGGSAAGSAGAAGSGGRGGASGAAGMPSAGAGAGATGGAPPPIQNGCSGYATRFWDCCKPHCGWSANVGGGAKPMNSCSMSNGVVGSDTQSSCSGGGAFMCQGLVPWAVNANLSYGYAATSKGDVCGRCFQLQFTGSSHNAGDDPGSRALAGKTMIVQAINVGFDVSGGQFDLAVPGGGVGAFNACSQQWGVSNGDLGAQYGGFVTTCKQQLGGNAGLDALKTCVQQRCTMVFQSRGLTDLAAGCRWYVDWFQAADNPALKYKEIACPQEITSKSGMRRNDVANQCGN